MPELSINFFSEGITFILKNKLFVRSWMANCALAEKKKIATINYIFCSDNYLKKINKQYLNHNFFTDIITFPTENTNKKIISGDIYISIDRVKENAIHFEVTSTDELHRVMIHGLLHLCGYGDASVAEKKRMRKKEDFYLVSRKGFK